MNLLTDAWIPVTEDRKFKHITLKNALCRDGVWDIALPRDDMEMATLQIVICLVQVIFPPKNATELKGRLAKPMGEKEFDDGIEKFIDWFELEHKDYPFMQTRGMKDKKVTPIQKLFVGLPAGNNDAFFNIPDEVQQSCSSCSVIVLFNQASNCPGFGGGYHDGLRGRAPVTTLVSGETLREKIWRNVLAGDFIASNNFPQIQFPNEKPVWVEKIKVKETILAQNVGLLRGLFWQPAHIELISEMRNVVCDSCGITTDTSFMGFRSEKFGNIDNKKTPGYKFSGTWMHPHSPAQWGLEDGKKAYRFLSFNKTAPSWTQMNDIMLAKEDANEGNNPASLISQYKNIFLGRDVTLLIGGYLNKQSSISGRRHEMFSISAGWDENRDTLRDYIQIALKINKVFRGKIYGFGKAIGVTGLANRSEERFYADSERYIHDTLRTMDWRIAKKERGQFVDKLIKLVWDIFGDITRPYQNEPRMIKAYATAKRNLIKEFKKIKEG
ncbi:MAG: type I-E CRISPR-associated protein Cse1/CasA [Elusimicrobia bacterium]|nr:type I-E CRISPR-associated protein Cse1/CasA [Elusimicrobiota bacterium]